MKVGIIGAGSIGLLFAAYLGKKFKVTIFPRRLVQAELINKEGITIQEKNSFKTNVSATVEKKHLNQQELIIVTVKQYHLESIITDLQKVNPQIPILFLQNGMLHLSQINHLRSDTILVGTVEHGALKVDDITVHHNGVGKTNIAVYRGEMKKIDQLLRANIPRFHFAAYTNYEEMLLKKLLVNAMINPLTAVLQEKNGQLINNTYYYQIFLELFNEVMVLFPGQDKEKLLKEIMLICSNTENNESSMLKDIKSGGKTEIDAISGYLLNIAKEKEIQLPITKMLYCMVKGMERGGSE